MTGFVVVAAIEEAVVGLELDSGFVRLVVG
jgi:hypothetical protein